MGNKIKSDRLFSDGTQLSVVILFFVILSFTFGYAYRYAINPDGVSYLRLAEYIADGNFQQSVTGAWSPLLTWLMAPFIILGFDGLTTARIVMAFCGAWLVLCTWMLSSRIMLSRDLRFIATLIASVLISDWTVRNIGPDILIASLIISYLVIVTNSNILTCKKTALFCGLMAGIAYLSKHYAFPFFLAHYPAMLFLRGYIDRNDEGFPLRKIAISFVIGLAGFLMVSSFWIIIMSAKFGELAVSPAGPIVHAMHGPKDMERRPPSFYGGLNKPENVLSINSWEDPYELKHKYKLWSPLESREYFMYQIELFKSNFIFIVNHFIKGSPFFTYPFVVGVLMFIVIVLLLIPLNKERKYLYGWVILTFSIHCSGYLLTIAKSPRRFYPLMLVALLLSFYFLGEFKKLIISGEVRVISARRQKLLMIFLMGTIILAFTLKPGIHLLKTINNIIVLDQMNPYEEIAEQLKEIDFISPYAIIRSSQKPHTDIYIAYYLKKQLLGRPLSQDLEGITEELHAADARSLLVFDHPEVVKELKNDSRYAHKSSIKIRNVEKYPEVVNINIFDHEIVTGWDEEVNVFILK